MVDEVKEIFHDHREISKFLSVLTQTGGYYLKGDEGDTVLLNSLELPAYQAKDFLYSALLSLTKRRLLSFFPQAGSTPFR